MGKIVRNLIEYEGIDTCSYENISSFKQFNVDCKFNLPEEKPNIDTLIKVKAEVCIEHKQIVRTPVGVSLEGQEVTGFKLLVCGDITLKYEYVISDTTQSVYSITQVFPFSDYIVLPQDFNMSSMLFPTVVIEDIYSEQINSRSIYNNITLLMVVEVC